MPDPFDYLPAAQANAANSQFQKDWNNYAAQAWAQRRHEFGNGPAGLADSDPSSGLVQRYSPFQQMELGQAGRDRAQRAYTSAMTGEASLGLAGRGLLNDPAIRGMPRDQLNALWQRTYGNTLDQDIEADRLRNEQGYGGGITANMLDQLSPASQARAAARLQGYERASGYNPSSVVSGYNPATGQSVIPGRTTYRVDEITGEMSPYTMTPDQKVAISPQDLHSLQNSMSIMQGRIPSPFVDQQAEVARLNELRMKRDAEREARVAAQNARQKASRENEQKFGGSFMGDMANSLGNAGAGAARHMPQTFPMLRLGY